MQLGHAGGYLAAEPRRGLRFRSVTYQREFEMPGWVGVIQVFNHQTHELERVGRTPDADVGDMAGATKARFEAGGGAASPLLRLADRSTERRSPESRP